MHQPGVQKELGYSIGLHALILLAGIVYLPAPNEFLVPENALPVDLISIEEFTRLSQPESKPQETKVQPQKVAPKSKVVPEVKPTPPTPAVAKVPTEPPSPVTPATTATTATTVPSKTLPPLEDFEKKSKIEPAPEAEAFVSLVARPRPLARPVPVPVLPEPVAKTFLDTNALQALLDKTPDEPLPEPPVNDPLEETEPLSLSEIDAFRAQMKSCWSVPVGAVNADNLAVRVELGLKPDGSLAYGPFVVDKSRIGDPYFRAAAESVLRAIRRCQPFAMPADKYQSWQRLELNFDPKRMFGG